jgi:replicative DNA helicase
LQERGQISTNSHGLTGSYLIDLVSAPTVVDPAYVAEIIRERAQRRRVIELHQRGLQRAYESADDAETQLRATEEELGRLPRGPSQKVEEAYEFRPGGSFILDTDPTPRALWGDGEQVLWADGEALIIAGAQGLGKTTLAQQLALGWIGFEGYGELLDMPITPGMLLLYLAMDRPRQAARSFRRMVTDDQRGELNDRLLVWAGPPPQDLARYPSLLLKLCDQAMADAVIVDSLKDAAIPLSDDDVGAGYNRARQMACVNGVQVAELHHVRKQQTSKKAEAELTIDDLYGSTWLTSGAGSVLLLTGKPGDPIVKMRHLKQPSAEVGPYTVLHNDVTGRSTIWHAMDLLEYVRACGPVTAFATAEQLFDTASPTAAEREKARRRLDRLVASGHLLVLDPGDSKTNRPTTWTAAL